MSSLRTYPPTYAAAPQLVRETVMICSSHDTGTVRNSPVGLRAVGAAIGLVLLAAATAAAAPPYYVSTTLGPVNQDSGLTQVEVAGDGTTQSAAVGGKD